MPYRLGVVVTAAATVGALGLSTAAAEPTPAPPPEVIELADGETALVRLQVPDQEMVDAISAEVVDLPGPSRELDGVGYSLDAVLDTEELQRWQERGARVTQVIQRVGPADSDPPPAPAAPVAPTAPTAPTAPAAPVAPTAPEAPATRATDTLEVEQAYTWAVGKQSFLGMQVTTSAVDDPAVQLDVAWTAADGSEGSFPLGRFVDAGQYRFHFAEPQPVPAAATTVRVTSSLGGSADVEVAPWTGVDVPPQPEGYQKGFVDDYLTPVEIDAGIDRIAAQYPDLVDVIDLPNPTQGYRRAAAGYLGDPDRAAVVVESVAFGSDGANGLEVSAVDPGTPGAVLGAEADDDGLVVTLGTDAGGTPSSTADEVAALITDEFPERFRAYVEDGSDGATLVPSAPVALDDGLDAGPEVPRAPWTVRALRIGAVRDGSKVGVLAYSQEHAREWTTPMVTMEFAERLVANYATDPATAELLDGVDVFVVPTANPDGANYSFNDFALQRKNMNNYCTGAERDPANADGFGVDINRNYSEGSLFDGFVGASEDCLSSVAAGPGGLLEPESANIASLPDTFPNIRFSMNVHSYGGYFMWPPGSYREAGRETLPRPSAEQSAEFQDSAERIVAAITAERGTVTWPARTGPVADVLYSAAGNSADQLYYDDDVFAWNFEVGNDVWNVDTRQWDAVGFQPPVDEARAEAQEYASGLVELVRVALDYADGGN